MHHAQPEGDSCFPGTGTLVWLAVLTLAVFAGLVSLVPPLPAAFTAYLFFTMALITLIDLRHFIIPDVLSLPAIAIGLLASSVLVPEGDRLAGLINGVAGAILGGGAFYLLRAVYFRFRGIEGLGLGDVKLAAVAGAWLGPAALAPACLLATLSAIAGVVLHGVLNGRRAIDARQPIPFGSFIAPAILILWIGQILDLGSFW